MKTELVVTVKVLVEHDSRHGLEAAITLLGIDIPHIVNTGGSHPEHGRVELTQTSLDIVETGIYTP